MREKQSSQKIKAYLRELYAKLAVHGTTNLSSAPIACGEELARALGYRTSVLPIPKKAWKSYNPDPQLKVWRQKQKKFVSLQELCSKNNDVEECPGLEAPVPTGLGKNEDGDAIWDDDEDKMQKQMKEKLAQSFPDDDPDCIAARMSQLFPEEKFDGPGMSPACMEAAKRIIDAVYDDAMKFGEYEGTQLQAEQSLQAIIEGDINSAQGGV